MIADDCKKLRNQLEHVAKAEANEKIVNQLNLRRQELLELKKKVVAATISLQAIASRTVIIGKLDTTKAFERVRKLRVALKVDPQSITKGSDFTYMRTAFDKFTDEVVKAATATWEQYLPRVQPKVDANQVAQAEQQVAFKTNAVRLKSRIKHAESLSKSLPASEEELVDLETVWQEVRTLLELLPAVTNDPKVRDFLKATNSSNGASLDMLTEEVLAYLNKNKAADKYRIFNLNL